MGDYAHRADIEPHRVFEKTFAVLLATSVKMDGDCESQKSSRLFCGFLLAGNLRLGNSNVFWYLSVPSFEKEKGIGQCANCAIIDL